MPSASMKIENRPVNEGPDPLKRILLILDKKVRNMEKRKLKLDSIKDKQSQGAKLEKDQQAAVDKYDEVKQNLEFARDLQKQFTAVSVDVEKLMKKQAKKTLFEKQLQEVKRMKEVLAMQGLLDSMGSENVRKDFQTGKQGAIVLTEENLEQIDELYKLISPNREGEGDYHEALSKASEHIINLLDGRDKPVVGSTYKELKELLDLVAGCGYFEKSPPNVNEDKSEEQTEDSEYEIVDRQDVPHPDSEEVQASLPPEVPEDTDIEDSQTLNSQQQVNNLPTETNSFFSDPVNTPHAPPQQQTLEQQQQAVATAAYSRRRPFQEIVSSVQGSFNFLQESTIETEAKREFSPHMDPAVVAAHPMPQSQPLGIPPSTNTPDKTTLTATGFVASSFSEQLELDTNISVTSHGTATHGPEQIILSQDNSAQSQDLSNAGFSQSGITHSLQTDELFSGGVVTTSSDNSAASRTHCVLGGKPTSDVTLAQFEIPPEIPMPPGHDQSHDIQSNQPEKKGYPMNPNASEFQSLIYTQSDEQDQDIVSQDSSNYQGSSSSYSNNNYNRDQRGGRGGFRNNRSNRGNMTNGFSRGGRNGNFERSNSGGNNQGYQQRSDYNRGDNYQGYQGNSSNSYNNGGFQKRVGSSGGYQRGGSRGGTGYSRGGGGGNNNYNRGGGRGFGRPNFNQQQGGQ